MVTTGPRFLFVYGTLRSTASSAMGRGQRARLDAASRIAGPATAAGYLFDLGGYPGLVLKRPDGASNDAGFIANKNMGRVTGELRELADPDDVFSWLDVYEGIGVNAQEADAYRREILPVIHRDASGNEVVSRAWIYVYQGPLTGARFLSDGVWQV